MGFRFASALGGRLALAFARNWLLGLAAVAIWLLCFYGQYRPAVAGGGAPAHEFSAARADAVLARLLGPERPHPAGSAENAVLHTRLLVELQRLGVKTDTLHTMSCYAEVRLSAITCATVTDIIGRVAHGTGPAIVLMAHTDSVAAGPGAADDESGVATILETIRAWKALGSTTRHPILALFTDGEENAMLGASAFLADPKWRAQVGVVINLEARGNQGRSFLFQTSPGDGALIDLYAHAVPHLATSSLYAEIYKILPNDTDLTPFLQAGFTGYNFAFVGDVAQYHTPRDRRENLDLRALQQHGESALGLTTALAQSDFAQLKRGDSIYFDVLGLWLPRLPKSWALPLSLLAFAGIALAGWLRQGKPRPLRRCLIGAAMPPLLLLGAVATGFALHEIAALISAHADPSFAHPWALRLALAFGVWSVALLCTRLRADITAAWAWIAGFGVLAALLLPGFTPYFLFPSLIATVLFLATVRANERARLVAAGIAALACVFTWLNLAATGEAIMGLVAHPLFTVSAAFALIAMLPLLRETRLRGYLFASGILALLFAVIAGFLPAFSAAAPERLNLHYVEKAGRAIWLADPATHLPDALRKAGHFAGPIESIPPFWRGYAGAAGKAAFAEPGAIASRKGDSVIVALNGSHDADGMMLALPPPERFTLKAINGKHFDTLPPVSRFICDTPDCAAATVTLDEVAQGAFDLVEMRRGLPLKGAALMLARPADAVPSGMGDQTLLIARIPIPKL
jgi:hypothetical protein